MNIEKENKQLKEAAKLAADASFKLSEQVYNLKAENERLKLQLAEIGKSWGEIQRLKTQYNCYACGNCNGKEDYINLEKHHKGLRKQFEKYYQQTLDDEIIINKLYQTLQDIKAIAETEYTSIDAAQALLTILDIIKKVEG